MLAVLLPPPVIELKLPMKELELPALVKNTLESTVFFIACSIFMAACSTSVRSASFGNSTVTATIFSLIWGINAVPMIGASEKLLKNKTTAIVIVIPLWFSAHFSTGRYNLWYQDILSFSSCNRDTLKFDIGGITIRATI